MQLNSSEYPRAFGCSLSGIRLSSTSPLLALLAAKGPPQSTTETRFGNLWMGAKVRFLASHWHAVIGGRASKFNVQSRLGSNPSTRDAISI